MRTILAFALFLFVTSESSLFAQVSGTPHPLCCSPAAYAMAPPYDVGCTADCQTDLSLCASRGNTSGPHVNGGNCHLSSGNNECTVFVASDPAAPQWICNQTNCSFTLYKCEWAPNGTGDFQYEDCFGDLCS